ncbi:MAG: CCA tRNA nucleotidyltransferase [Lachnospirales bacterium]
MILPDSVKYIISKLNKEGFEGYVVGGCVRDYIMGITPHDYDITTSAKPMDIKRIFSHTIDTGIEHGTVTVVVNKENFEITTYRIDGEYEDNRHPKEVIFTNKLEGDLSRRDFTVNAIAYNDNEGFVDIFGGIGDIKNKIIRGVGDADRRFKEDALRMMRALRFSAQLDFKIEDNTFNAIKNNSSLIKNISMERIREELFKLILSDNNERLALLYESGMTEYFCSELYEILGNCNDDFYKFLNSSPKDIASRLAYVFKGYDIKKILKNLKTDNKTINKAYIIEKYFDFEVKMEYDIRKLISLTGEYCADLLRLRKEDLTLFNKAIENKWCCSIKDLAIKGEDLIKLNYKGKEIGEKLNFALQYVLENPDKNNKEDIIKVL